MPLTDILSAAGAQAFGIDLPRIAPDWASELPLMGADALSLDLPNGAHWRAPFGGFLRRADHPALEVPLLDSLGAPLAGNTLVLALSPPAYARLRRLYALELEDAETPGPGRELGLSVRPVPRFFAFAASDIDDDELSIVRAGDALSVSGALSIHDGQGFPLDPRAVASALMALLELHPVLEARGWQSLVEEWADKLEGEPEEDDTPSQLEMIAHGTMASQGGDLEEGEGEPVGEVRVRLVDAQGLPCQGENLEGVTAIDAARGLFRLDPAALDTDPDETPPHAGWEELAALTVAKQAATDTEGAFPPRAHASLQLGPTTVGWLGDGPVGFPARAPGVFLPRDFFSLEVVDLEPLLLGELAHDAGDLPLIPRPRVRRWEQLALCPDGNDVLAAGTAALAAAEGVAEDDTQETLVVAPAIEPGFTVPDAPGAAARWPQWPEAEAGIEHETGPLPMDLDASLSLAARFIDHQDADPAGIDVALTIDGLPQDAAVRVYHRCFVSRARERRGNGAGGVVGPDGKLKLHLRDPLGRRRPGLSDEAISVPTGATLHVDVMVVRRDGNSRLFGNLFCPIAAATADPPPAAGVNLLSGAARIGVAPASVLGLRMPESSAPAPSTSDPAAVVSPASEAGTERVAPLLPTMARREMLIAALTEEEGWSAVLSAGRIEPGLLHAGTRLGAPGSPGGRETATVGVATSGGRLAYDIARSALRRTTGLVDRLGVLLDERWQEPPEPTPPGSAADSLDDGDAMGFMGGTAAAALLQTISPHAETPELSLLKAGLEAAGDSLPSTFNALVDWLESQLPEDEFPGRQQLLDALDDLRSDDPLSEDQRERLYGELRRELTSSAFGRQDALYALDAAFSRARQFVYIESSGLTALAGDADGPNPLVTLANRMAAMPHLRVVVCLPKQPDHGPGYDLAAAHDVHRRLAAIGLLPTASSPDPDLSRVVVFHPLGFPGRDAHLEATTVVVDDRWALIGSSTLRRRGLTFDGGTDLVLTDAVRAEGICPRLRAFRTRLMGDRLGIPEHDSAGGVVADRVRLADGRGAAGVVREMLRGGGLGRIERLWAGRPGSGETFGLGQVDPDKTDPDGRALNTALLLALRAEAALGASGE